MKACLDVDYRASGAVAAGVAFAQWEDASAAHEWTVAISAVAPYEPGDFRRRELPCLLALLAGAPCALDLLVIDGYTSLGRDRDGLGAFLHREAKLPVVGVAKSRFLGADAIEVYRGSRRALYVTAIGISAEKAADAVRGMHGNHRIPTLLKRVDSLARC